MLGNFSVPYCSEVHYRNELEALGHTVYAMQEPRVSASEIETIAKKCDLFVWVHTHGWDTPNIRTAIKIIKAAGTPVIAYHLDLYMGISRWQTYKNNPYIYDLDHFFTVDKLMADWLNDNTEVKGHYLPAGVYSKECYLEEAINNPPHEVLFVGSRGYHPEWKYRPQLIDWLKDTYRDRFAHYGNDGKKVVRGAELNRLYADSKVVIGDTLCINYDYPYYFSDRIFETIGRGGFIIHPYIKGLEDLFTDKEHAVFYEYGNFNQLKELIDYYLENEEEREKIRISGHEHVKKNHTYKNRWQTILSTVEGDM